MKTYPDPSAMPERVSSRTSYSAAFEGSGGATSLKAEIVGRIPRLCEAAEFREARRQFLELGGPAALLSELIFSGFVDPETKMLTLEPKPSNIFAHLAAGREIQPWMQKDQEALGHHQRKFLMCGNLPDADMHWDSTDPKWIPKASMAQRHRFLTTKNLHWSWFNLLIAGLIHPDDGGTDIRAALSEVEEMKSAALLFTKNIGGWSAKIGLFVSIFGHNGVNSLFLHVLDMSCLGPGFSFHSERLVPLDDILKVLREEVASNLATSPHRTAGASVHVRRRSVVSGPKVPFFFTGQDGATSCKDELVGRVPVSNDAAGFREARRLLKEELGGTNHLREELVCSGFVDDASGQLTTGMRPFNIFARVAAGEMVQPGMADEQQFLGEFAKDFVVCSNLPANDAHWDSQESEWVGKASMSRRHRFLTTKNLKWHWFNVLSFGLSTKDGGATAQEALEFVEAMKRAALTYVEHADGWSNQVGLFFHVFGHNSVNSLHMHILDMAHLGPTFWKYEYKNCPIDAIVKVLNEEAHAGGHGSIPRLAAATESAARAAEQMAAQAMKFVTGSSASLPMDTAMHSVYCRPTISRGMNAVLNLNVGGEIMTIARDTLLLAPEGSLLSDSFGPNFEATARRIDDQGRVFLDFPPRSFRLIVSQLQLLRLTPHAEFLNPTVVPETQRREFEDLVWLLGMEEFMLMGQNGKAPGDPRQLPPRAAPQIARAPKQMLMLMQQNGSTADDDCSSIPGATSIVCSLCAKKCASAAVAPVDT